LPFVVRDDLLQPAHAANAYVVVAQVDNLYVYQEMELFCQSFAYKRAHAQLLQVEHFDTGESFVLTPACPPGDASCDSRYVAHFLRKGDGAQKHADDHLANVVVELAGLRKRGLSDHSTTHCAYCVENLLLMDIPQTCVTQRLCMITDRRFENMQPFRKHAKTVVGRRRKLPELEPQQGVVVILGGNAATFHGTHMLRE
jgi:hypothetical protein